MVAETDWQTTLTGKTLLSSGTIMLKYNTQKITSEQDFFFYHQ